MRGDSKKNSHILMLDMFISNFVTDMWYVNFIFELGLRFASLASLGWGHSQLSREFVCLGFRHFLKFSPDIFITFSETSSNYVLTLIVSIYNKIIGQIKELKNWKDTKKKFSIQS